MLALLRESLSWKIIYDLALFQFTTWRNFTIHRKATLGDTTQSVIDFLNIHPTEPRWNHSQYNLRSTTVGFRGRGLLRHLSALAPPLSDDSHQAHRLPP
jgi:hypothetical protein